MLEWNAIFFGAGMILQGTSLLVKPDPLEVPIGTLAAELDTGDMFIVQYDAVTMLPVWRKVLTA